MKNAFSAFTLAALCAAALSTPLAAGEEMTVRPVKFAPGATGTTLSASITGRESILFTFHAREGQFLDAFLRPDNQSAGYNIYIPGRGPGDEALFNSETGGGYQYVGQLYKTGQHSISVFLNRAAASRGETASFDLTISLTDTPPGQAEEKPSTEPVPQRIIDDCRAALRKQLGSDQTIRMLGAKRGESAFEVTFEVEGARAPWKCSHDGRKVTNVMFTGSEGYY